MWLCCMQKCKKPRLVALAAPNEPDMTVLQMSLIKCSTYEPQQIMSNRSCDLDMTMLRKKRRNYLTTSTRPCWTQLVPEDVWSLLRTRHDCIAGKLDRSYDTLSPLTIVPSLCYASGGMHSAFRFYFAWGPLHHLEWERHSLIHLTSAQSWTRKEKLISFGVNIICFARRGRRMTHPF